ncbi:hypothetical protein CDQ92_09120 [Sphingopyxis bauzanensis]|uniref:Uncharacterized protein n=1 Tax=Sphingopyxis bauzanensis TaxID=651663 RepID=A0A246JVW7_9SPHN|nr:hypothetical protein [Sphingopyxis bauzanensis]OWQ97210.1 hypothetical protein CDQ92_09120 [Sphingopyxis bauzanensis]GGJ48185.1 hypothetical protein GCM10011393_18000 [Sphingopyxis bauzanensis]
MNSDIATAILIACSACSSTTDFQPSDAEIAKLERKLPTSHCVGDLDNWQRAYVRKESLENEAGQFDSRMIEFTLQRADGKVAVAGRKQLKRYEDWVISGDCREPDCLFGGYVISTDELLLECGGPSAP